jgi:hypothetical protein
MGTPVFTFNGVSSSLEVYPDRIEIKPSGFLGKIGGQGGESIFLRDITSVEVRECSFINSGHIQFSAPGTSESNNKVEFGGFGDRKGMNANALEIKEYVLKQIQSIKANPTPSGTVSSSDELLKLASLKEQGIITDEEFQSAKKRLLGL